MPLNTLVNGHYSNSVSVENRGLAYGDGVFETIRLERGQAVFLDRHLRRLQRACDRLRIRCDCAVIRDDLDRLLSAGEYRCGVIKITVTRGSSGRGYGADFCAASQRIVSVQAVDIDNTRQQHQGVVTRLCDTRLSINPQLAGLKHLCRLENVLARSEWSDADIAEGLMLDTDGRLIEGTASNLFLVRDNKLSTASLHRCGVDGVTRQVIIEQLLPSLGLACDIADLAVDDVYRADEMFLCNSLMGVWPVIAIGCHKKRIGSVTIAVQQALRAEILRVDKPC